MNIPEHHKSIFKYLTIKNLRMMAESIAERMPLSAVLVLIAFSLLIWRISAGDLSSAIENIIGKSMIAIMVMFLLSIAMYLLSEAYKSSKLVTWRNQIFTIIFGIAFYYSFEENLFSNLYAESFVYITITIVGIISAVFIAPFIKKIIERKARQREFCIFGYKTIAIIIKSATVGIITLLMGFIALWATTVLFSVTFENMFSYWAAFSLTLLATMFFLANMPSAIVDTSEQLQEQKFYAFLIKYVALPAIVIYFVILYAYTAKVLANYSQWPQGEITWLVIIFSFLGYLVYSASYVFEQDLKPIKIFRRVFPYVILPQVIMLFYAISLRINQYDLTINRYLVVVFGIYLLIISLHFIFSKRKYLGVIPLGLIVAILIISIGPLSVYSYPESRQLANLEQNLLSSGILDEQGEVRALSDAGDISPELSGEIYGAIEYLCNYHGCDSLRSIFSAELLQIESQQSDKSDYEYEVSSWSIVNQLTERINVKRYYNNDDDRETMLKYISFYVDYDSRRVIEVSGYDYYIEISSAGVLDPNGREPKLVPYGIGDASEAQYKALVDIDAETLEIYREGELVEELSIESELDNIIKNNPIIRDRYGAYRMALNSNDLTFDLAGESLDIRVSLSNISLKNPQWEGAKQDAREPRVIKIAPAFASGYVLIKDR